MATGLGPTTSLPGRSIALGTVLAVLASLFSFFAPAGVASAADVVYNSAADLPPSCSQLDPDYAASQSLCRQTLPGSGQPYTVASQTYSWEHVGPRDWRLHVDLTLDWADTALLDPFSGQPNGKILRTDFWSVTSDSREGHGVFHNAHPDAFATFAGLSSYDGPVAGTNQQETFQHCANHVVCHLTFNDPPVFMPGTAYWLPIAVQGYQAHVVGQSPENPSWDPSYSPNDLWTDTVRGPRHDSTYLRLVEHPSDATGINSLSSAIVVTRPDGTAYVQGSARAGDQLVAHVTLSNAAGSPAITGLTRDDALSSFTSAAVLDAPSPLDTTTLAPGAATTYDVPLTARSGRTTLHVAAHGDNPSRQETSTDELLVMGSPLSASITWRQGGQPLVLRAAGATDRPDTLKLADADDGEVPQDVQAVLTVTNVSTVTQEHITINGRPVPSFHDAAHALPSVPLSVTDGPPTNTPIPEGASGTTSGTLAPGASASLTYTVHVRDNGVFDLSAQLLSSDVGGTSTNVSTGSGTLTVVPTALLWLQLKRVDNAPVRAGLPVEIRGTLTNRSQTQIVNAAPLEPVATTGNAGGGRLVDDTSPANLALSYLADGVQLPFLGPVKPGQKITLKGVIDTTYVPSTLATLTYEPAGQVVNTDGTTTDLTVSQVGTATGTTPIKITIDARDPDVPPADVQTEIQNFENSVAQGTGAWAEGNFRAALGFLQHPVDSGVAGVGGVAKAILHSPRDVASAASILASVSYYNAVYLALTPQQRANFERSILDDFDASTAKADNAELSKAVHAGFGAFADALAHQDYNKVASLAGSGVATSGGLVVDTLLSDIFFQKLALGVRAAPGASRNFVRGSLTDALVLADEVRNAKLSKTIIKTTDGITAGQNLLVNHASALINAWGLTPAQIAGLINFCKDNQIILAVRSRSKRAADLIRRGLAIGKNEILKLKAVNPIDVEWLGYHQADLNKLINAEPISRSELIDELLRRHASPQLEEIVLERWQLRHDEWHSPKVRGVMQAADAKGQIEWGFNGTDNGAPAADRTALRKFQLRTVGHVEMPYGPRKPRIYQQVLVGNRPGRIGALVGVTQDVDIAAILEKTNTISSALKRTKFYEYLSDVIGIEHPETVSWINKGEILFAAKYKELSRLFYGGGEVLAVFGPDGIVRAGFINPALTIYNATTKGGLIIFDGGYNNIYSKAASRIVVNLKNFF